MKNERLKFTRDDAERLIKIETDVSNLKQNVDKGFKEIHTKLDLALSLKEKINNHSAWISIFRWVVGTLFLGFATLIVKLYA